MPNRTTKPRRLARRRRLKAAHWDAVTDRWLADLGGDTTTVRPLSPRDADQRRAPVTTPAGRRADPDLPPAA
jgi:hypothetical protein